MRVCVCLRTIVEQMELLVSVVQAIDAEFVPALRRHALSGAATIKSYSSVFLDHPLAVDIAGRSMQRIHVLCRKSVECVELSRRTRKL